MTTPSLVEIKKLIEDTAAKIDAPAHLLPAYDSKEELQANIAVDANGYRYQIFERGQLITDVPATTEDELLYHVFRDISFSMAVNYEFNNRNPRQDFRRILFAKQAALMGQLNSDWKERIEKEKQLILQSHPFDDNSTQRMDYFNKLMKAGKTYEQAMSEANKKFPERH